MGLFSKLFRKTEQATEYTFILDDHYRGFKRFHMVVYGDKESEMNNERFSEDLSGHEIKFIKDTYDGKLFYKVYIDGLKVGAIFDEDQIRIIENGCIDAVYAHVEEQIAMDYKGKKNRHRIKLLIKRNDI